MSTGIHVCCRLCVLLFIYAVSRSAQSFVCTGIRVALLFVHVAVHVQCCSCAVLFMHAAIRTCLLRSRLPRAPIFTFSRALYPFPTCSHAYFFLPPLPALYLPFVVSFRPPKRLAIPGSTYPRLYLVRIPTPLSLLLSQGSCPPMYISWPCI